MKPIDDNICVDAIRYVMQILGGKWAFLVIPRW